MYREDWLTHKLESRDEQIQGLKSDIHDLEQENAILKGENKALKDIIDTYNKERFQDMKSLG